MALYRAQDARRVCGVTQRQLDHWVEKGYVRPSTVARTDRRFHFFDFEELIRIRLIINLREAGVSLQNIGWAIKRLRKKHGKHWQRAWIATDGKRLFEVTDDLAFVETLSKEGSGQMAFAVVALASTRQHVQQQLKRLSVKHVDLKRYKGIKKRASS